MATRNHWYPTEETNDDRPRIVIPATSHIPGNIYWQARAMDTDETREKYDSPFAPRGDAVVVVWPVGSKNNGGPINSVVVEGPMDALAAAGEGYVGIALMGITPPWLALELTSYLIRGTMCSIVADADAMGPMTTVMAFLMNKRLNVRIIDPSPYKDLAEAPPEARRNILGPYARPPGP